RCALILAACGHPAGTAHPPAATATGFSAARWVPAHPTYVLAARTVKAGQRALRDTIDALGTALDFDADDASRGLAMMLAVDPLSPDPVAGIGVDLDGGMAVFSEDVEPTIVVHLAAPDQIQAFFDHERQRGMQSRSVVVDGVEVFTA